MSILAEWSTTLFGRFDLSEGLLGNKWTQALLVLIIALILSRLLQNIVQRRLSNNDQIDDPANQAAIQTYKNMARLVVMAPAIVLAVHILGINMSSLFTTSGLFAVAIAFAMKNITENYIAGMLIRIEGSIKPGDVLETKGKMMRVKRIGFRDTIVRSKDEMDILVPNSQLIQESVANYTLKDSLCRVSTIIGVSYASDIDKVKETLENTCNKMEGCSADRAPMVRLINFAESSINYKVSVWVEDPWGSGSVRANLNESIWRGFKEADIEFAFPQLDVHFDSQFRHKEVIDPVTKNVHRDFK